MTSIDRLDLKTGISGMHVVALPYRGDGVARALQDIYGSTEIRLPADWAALLHALDAVPPNVRD